MANLKKTTITPDGGNTKLALETNGTIKITTTASIAPFEINSSKEIKNLNAEKLGGKTAKDFVAIKTLTDNYYDSKTIDNKNFQNNVQVEAAIDKRGYKTEPQIQDIAKKTKVDQSGLADNSIQLGGVDATKYYYARGVKTPGQFYTGTDKPQQHNRLNFDGDFYASKVFGAVYNDYAETRLSTDNLLKPGFVVTDAKASQNKFDLVELCNDDRCINAYVITDTYGFLIGEQEHENFSIVPVAVAGRVLAYVDHKETLSVGDLLCTNNHGTLRKMSLEEYQANPLAVIGVVSSIPEYTTWGDVEVNNRVWVALK